MRFCKPDHSFRQRKKKAVRKKDQEALVRSSENINRKDRKKERKKRSFFRCLTGLQWQGKVSQLLATFEWQSHANALREKAAHLLAFHTLKHNKATS